MADPKLTVVLACYNEEEILETSFLELRNTLLLLNRSFEIVIVDDLSRDGTRNLIEKILAANRDLNLRAIFHDRNQGRGATVTDGFRAARGDVAGYLDIDLEVHCRYIPSLLQAIESGADVATVRRIYAFQLRYLDRYFMSRGYSLLVRRLLGTRLHDTETGFKFFRRERLMEIIEAIEDPRWFWDTEFMIRAERSGRRIVELPGAYVRREDKTSTVSGLRDSALYFSRLVRFRASLRRKR
jgi:glycosyltransferase involved in cell wall biosynthesis